MKTNIKKVGDTTVISMDGKIDFETQEPLKADLRRLMQNNKSDSAPKKIIFDLENLEFVGSSGISAFVQTLKEFNHRAAVRPVYTGVRSEFKRVIKAFDEDNSFDFGEIDERLPGTRKNQSTNH